MSHHLSSLLERLPSAQASLYKGILLVGPRGAGKSKLLWAVQAERHYPLLNVSLALAERLAPVRPDRRSAAVDDAFSELLADAAPDDAPVLLDNLELLFDRSLQMDPHRLLCLSSRNRLLIAAWPGTITGGLLTYAYPGHQEFKEWPQVELPVFSL